MSERQSDVTSAERSLGVARPLQFQSAREPAGEHERTYEHVIDALCSAAGRILDVSFAADGEPTVPEYP